MNKTPDWMNVQVYADGFGTWHAKTNDPQQARDAIGHQLKIRDATIDLSPMTLVWRPVMKEFAEHWPDGSNDGGDWRSSHGVSVWGEQ